MMRLPSSQRLAKQSSVALTAYAVRTFSTRIPALGYHLRSFSPSPSYKVSDVFPSRAHISQRRHYAEVVIKVPEMAESISEGTLKQWSKSVGDFVERDEEIATIETDKIDVSVNAPEAGTISELMAKEEDTVNVGQEIAKMKSGATPEGGKKEATSGPKEPASEKQETASQPQGQKEQEASAAEKQQPSGGSTKGTRSIENSSQEPPLQRGENTSRDEEPKSKQREPEPMQDKPEPKPKAKSKEEVPQPRADKPKNKDVGQREERRVKMNRMRLRIAERLKQSQNTAASLTTFQKVDMSALMDFRRKYKDDILKKTGIKLGFMSAFTRASILAMKDIPSVNASIEGTGSGDTIVYRDYVDVSVAVATEKGLVTPVVRNAESLDLIGIESAIAELGKKARDNKLTIEDMAGGTFTISNGGVFGSLFGTPIINLPQTAVLGLHAINEEVVVVDGKFEARPIMYLALTYDHRLLDGREAVTFLVNIKRFIEDPARMLLI